jgi:hypothetical protein
MNTPRDCANRDPIIQHYIVAIKHIGALLLFVLTTLTHSSHALAGKDSIYRWVDENGVTHYGEKPPEKREVQVDKLKTRKDFSSDAKAAQNALEDKRAAKKESEDKTSNPTETAEKLIAERKKKIEEDCKTAKGNLDILTSHGRVKEATEDGSQRFLSEEEHVKRIKKMTTYINDNCSSQ